MACLGATLALAAAGSPPPATSPKAPPLAHVRQLDAMSGRLVSRIKAGTAKAAPFRVHVAVYREMLRELMLANPEVDRVDRLPNSLLMKLVRMAALLQAAAACQTGRDIICSLTLVSELDRQQQRLGAALDHRPGREGSP
ncbi:MAG: hypothetical protein P8180_13445 [Gammaproteobacteria bacterium]